MFYGRNCSIERSSGMTPAKTTPCSVYGVPLLGLAGLLVCLWHPQAILGQMNPDTAGKGPDGIYLVSPSPRLDKSMTILLKQEARNVAYSRKHDGRERQAKVAAEYNIVAQECTPAVFQATHLPSSL